MCISPAFLCPAKCTDSIHYILSHSLIHPQRFFFHQINFCGHFSIYLRNVLPFQYLSYFFPDDFGVPKYYEGIFLASDEMIDNEPDVLAGFLTACSKGFEDFKNSTDEVLQVLLDNQDEANFALDPDVEKKSCETLLPLMETEDAKFLSQTEQCWQENIDWMYDQGLIAEKPDVSDVMVNLDF